MLLSNSFIFAYKHNVYIIVLHSVLLSIVARIATTEITRNVNNFISRISICKYYMPF
ncbi:hypothetical protein Deiofobo_0425 [Pseudomonas phage Deifobo]|nr:hypothetical protein Deiofobo_0425 [Pseudomonas phage Deifobo]